MVRLARAVAAALSIGLAGAVIAADTWWSPVLVSDPPEHKQLIGAGLAADSGGDFWTVWTEEVNPFTSNVWMRKMGRDGKPMSAPLRLNDADGRYLAPAIGDTRNGEHVVVWGFSPSGSGNDLVIFKRRFDGVTGAPLEPEVMVASGASAPRLAVHAYNHVVAWSQGGVTHARVFGVGGPFPEFTMPNLGEIFGIGLDWQNDVVAASMTPAGALLQCFTAVGTAHAPPLPVPAQGAADPATGSLMTTSDGPTLLTWVENDASSNIRLRQIHSDCRSLMSTTDVVTGAAGLGATHVVNGNRHFSGVSWLARDAAGTSAYVRMFDWQLQPAGDAHEVVAGQAALTVPQLGFNSFDAIVAAWSQGGDVYASGTGKAYDDGRRDLSVTLVMPATAGTGRIVTIDADVFNHSAPAATQVRVELTLPADFTVENLPWNCTQAGTRVTCEHAEIMGTSGGSSRILARTGATGGTQAVTAQVTGAEEDPDLSNNQAQADITIYADAAELSVYASGESSQVLLGESFVMGVTVWNIGPAAATNLTVQLDLGAMQFEALESGPGTCQPSSCVVESLPAGESVELRVRLRAPDVPGTHRIGAVVSSDAPDPNLADNSRYTNISVVSPPIDLAIGLSAAPAVMAPGSDTVVTATIANQNPGSISQGFLLDLAPPDGFTVKSISAPGLTCPEGGYICQYTSLLAGGESVTVNITLTAPYALGKYSMSAAVYGGGPWDPVPDNNQASQLLEVAVCGISDTSSQPDPHYKLKTNNGVDFHFHMGDDGVCDVRVK